jgi:hypothetical protein
VCPGWQRNVPDSLAVDDGQIEAVRIDEKLGDQLVVVISPRRAEIGFADRREEALHGRPPWMSTWMVVNSSRRIIQSAVCSLSCTYPIVFARSQSIASFSKSRTSES